MLSEFQNQVAVALDERGDAKLPVIGWLVAGVVVLTFFFCVLSVFAVPAGKPPELNFEEGGAVNALSAIYLTLGCGFAVASGLLRYRMRGSIEWLWVILAVGLAFLAFDELLQFHERAGRLVLNQISESTFFRNWNDLIVLMYGVIALPVMLILLPRVLKYRWVLELMVASFVFYLIHTLIDSTQDPPSVTSHILEESAKLFSTAFLAVGSLVGLLGNTWRLVDSEKENRTA